MGIKEGALALADELEAFEDGDCEECSLYGQPECKGHLSCMEIMARYAARKMREAVERDGEGTTTVSAYDLLGDDDREALAWVRERGGLDHVKAEWRSRVPYDLYERRRRRLLGHIAECETALGRRNQRIEELGNRVRDLASENAELRKRAMPEGCEWPRYESGEMVQIGDDVAGRFSGNPIKVRSIEFRDGDTFLREGCKTDSTILVYPGERVKRPAPKVLDADGVEIRVGDRLYDTDTGCGRTVRAVNDNGTVEFDGYENRGWFAKFLTHRAPVLAADGKPLREGEHVYHVETGAELVVKELPKPGEYQAVVVFALPTSPASHLTSFDPNLLTHRAPVLAADGEPLEAGQTVWHVGNGVEFTVIGLPNPGEYQAVKLRLDDGAFTGLDPDQLTHQRPVLAADGKPLIAGENVWLVSNGEGPYLVIDITDDRAIVDGSVGTTPGEMLTHQRPVLDADGVPIREGDTLWRVDGDGPFTAIEYKKAWMRVKSEDGHVVGYWPDDLTHAKPEQDTWERIEEDAKLAPGDYIEKRGRKTDLYAYEEMPIDLVRRCRALAERGEL